MSCPHGVWHEEDCEVCEARNEKYPWMTKCKDLEHKLADTENRNLVLDSAIRLHVERLAEVRTELAALNRMLMTLFMEERDSASDRGQDFFMPSDIWLADLRARAEVGKP